MRRKFEKCYQNSQTSSQSSLKVKEEIEKLNLHLETFKTWGNTYSNNPSSPTSFSSDYLFELEELLKSHIQKNPRARLPYQLLFRIVWEAQQKITN